MHRCFLALVAMLFASSAIAQVTLSADVSYSHRGYAYTKGDKDAFNADLPAGYTLEVMPKVGFRTSDNMTLGALVGYRRTDYTTTMGLFNPLDSEWMATHIERSTMNFYTIGAYMRMTCLRHGKLSVALELTADCGLGWGGIRTTEFEANYGSEVLTRRDLGLFEVDASVLPVLCYAFDDHFGMDAYLNLAAVAFNYTVTSQWMPVRLTDYGSPAKPTIDSRTATTGFHVGVNGLSAALMTLGFHYTF